MNKPAYAIFKILSENADKEFLTIDARHEMQDGTPPLGVWVLKSKAVLISEEEYKKITEKK